MSISPVSILLALVPEYMCSTLCIMYLSCDLTLDINAQVLRAVAESIRIEYIPFEIFLAVFSPAKPLKPHSLKGKKKKKGSLDEKRRC